MIPRYNNSPAFPLTRRPRSLSQLFRRPSLGSSKAGGCLQTHEASATSRGWVLQGVTIGPPTLPKAPSAAECPAPRFPGSNPWHSAFQGCCGAKERGSCRTRSCGGVDPVGDPGGRAVGCLTLRNVNREPGGMYAGMDLCSPGYYSANPYPQGMGSGEGGPFAGCI